MGFSLVYKLLQEIFPQVDVRLLKAVAFEHSKDADGAVEAVVSEILPFVSKQMEASRPINGSTDDHPISGSSSLNAPHPSREIEDLKNPSVGGSDEATTSTPLTPGTLASEKSSENCHTGAPCSDSTCLDEPIDVFSATNIVDRDDTDQVFEDNEERPSSSNQEMLSSGLLESSYSTSNSTIHEETVMSDSCSDTLLDSIQEIQQVADGSCEPGKSDELRSCQENTLRFEDVPSSSLQDSLAGNEDLADLVEHESGSRGSLENAISDFEMNIENDYSSATVVTQSTQICRMDLLEDAIEDAKSNKQTLFSAMETVINMMKKVELQEKEAENVKDEAEKGGLDILVKVEELSQMLQHAKTANDMHAGEVYGEKAILATEARELQSRVVNLSEERDKSLAVLDEMRQSLEARIAAAEEIKSTAEKEKEEKEKSAKKALMEQELIMEKVVQESKRLQLEAEENAKLRDFLMDRGRVVDTLQGEIAVICQDVKFLKEKFDDRVPLSKSLSSSQTSFLLASSTSFSRGLISDWVSDQGKLGTQTPKRLSPESSVSEHSETKSPVKKVTEDDSNVGSDDEWDLFED